MHKYLVVIVLSLALVSCGDSPSSQGSAAATMHKSGKRGVAFSFTRVDDLPLLSPYISWDYNWGNTATDNAALWFDNNDMDFCPMCWNGNYSADRIREYVRAHPKTKYLLAFNEPNLNDQAHMTPKEAAAIWQPVVSLAKELGLKLVSPAMNYGTLAGYGDPIKWLDEFFQQPEVSIDDVDAISIHCYMGSASAAQGFVEMFYKYNKPIWLTEFCAWENSTSLESQKNYMTSMLNYLEQNDKVERYSWFIPRSSAKVDSHPYMQLLTHDSPAALTELGQIYCLFSSFDKSAWLLSSRFIHAGEYIGISDGAMTLRPTTDQQAITLAGSNGLMSTNFREGHSLTYQLSVPQNTSTITLRYCGYSNTICEVAVDSKTMTHVEMSKNGSTTEWTEASAALSLKKGQHTIELKIISGSCLFSGFKVE